MYAFIALEGYIQIQIQIQIQKCSFNRNITSATYNTCIEALPFSLNTKFGGNCTDSLAIHNIFPVLHSSLSRFTHSYGQWLCPSFRSAITSGNGSFLMAVSIPLLFFSLFLSLLLPLQCVSAPHEGGTGHYQWWPHLEDVGTAKVQTLSQLALFLTPPVTWCTTTNAGKEPGNKAICNLTDCPIMLAGLVQ